MSRMQSPPEWIPKLPATPIPQAVIYLFGVSLHRIEAKQLTWTVGPTDSRYEMWRVKFSYLAPKARSRRSLAILDLPFGAVILEGIGHPEYPASCWRLVPSCMPGEFARSADPKAAVAFLTQYVADTGTEVLADFRGTLSGLSG